MMDMECARWKFHARVDCSSMGTIVRSALVGYSAMQMYSLVENIEAYPQFLPWCQSARVIERVEGKTVAAVCVGLKGLKQSFTTENINLPGESIDMRLVEGPFRSFGAAWKFQALSDAAGKIQFSMSYEFSSRLLARALDPLFDHIANTMVDAFIRRAESVYGPPLR
jgi:ribosome-associated toxin RatA of RatAB toxin-antitoxin module